MRQQGREIALTTYGLSDKRSSARTCAWPSIAASTETDALAALTTVPAKLCGVESQLGTIEPGKLANLTVVEGKSYFDPEAKVREVWIDGRIHRVPGEEPKPAQKPRSRRSRAGATSNARSRRKGRGARRKSNCASCRKPGWRARRWKGAGRWRSPRRS